MKLDDTPARALSADPAERLVDAIDLPIGRWVMSGDEARLLFCNAPYTRWACRPSADLVGRTLTELYGPAAWAAAKDAFAVAFGGKAVYYERRITHQGAAARWVRVQVFPDRNAEGGRLRCGERLYLKGLGMHSAARLTYALDGPYQRFEAELLQFMRDRHGDLLRTVHDTGELDQDLLESAVVDFKAGFERSARVEAVAGDGQEG